MDSERIKKALKNIDSIVSNVSLPRVQHAQLAEDVEVVQIVCKKYFAEEAGLEKEPEGEDV